LEKILIDFSHAQVLPFDDAAVVRAAVKEIER